MCRQVGPAERALRNVRPVRVQRAVVVAGRAAPLHPGAADSAVRAAAGGALVHVLTHCGRGVGHAAPRRGAQPARHADGQEQKKGMCSCENSDARHSTGTARAFIVPVRSIFYVLCAPRLFTQRIFPLNLAFIAKPPPTIRHILIKSGLEKCSAHKLLAFPTSET